MKTKYLQIQLGKKVKEHTKHLQQNFPSQSVKNRHSPVQSDHWLYLRFIICLNNVTQPKITEYAHHITNGTLLKQENGKLPAIMFSILLAILLTLSGIQQGSGTSLIKFAKKTTIGKIVAKCPW